jgi:hypothetical protein
MGCRWYIGGVRRIALFRYPASYRICIRARWLSARYGAEGRMPVGACSLREAYSQAHVTGILAVRREGEIQATPKTRMGRCLED